MITLVIVVILMAVALPTFMNSIRKGRRSEAMAALTAVQQEQERWRSNNQQYSNSFTDLRVSSTSAPGRYYTLSIPATSATGYTALADGTASSQVNDGDCAVVAVKVERGTIEYAACRSCTAADLVFSASNQCWSR